VHLPDSIDTDHVVILQKIDKIILAAEEKEYELGFRRRLYALRNLVVCHAGKAQDIKDEIENIIHKNKNKILIVGIALTSSIFIPYFVLTRTTWLMPKPITCKEFPTNSRNYPGRIQVCINGVTKAYSVQSGDVELDLTFLQAPRQRVQVDAVFWIADQLGDKNVDYKGEYNIERIRIYNNSLLVEDKEEKISAWLNPVVPVDVQLPLWEYVCSLKHTYNFDRMPVEEKLSNYLKKIGPLLAGIGSIVLTVYRFIRAGRGLT
jgi:hypothetical protein